MKTKSLTLLYITLVFTSACSVSSVLEINDDFLMDLASENYRLSGEMYLDEFDEDLSDLSYEFYINYLTQHQAPSAEELSKKIKIADDYSFNSKEDGFFIVLLYKGENKIIGDDSKTALLDTVIVIKELYIPKLDSIAQKFGY